MIKISICPKCFNYRIVSRRPKADCYHCGELLHETGLEYNDYTYMTIEERENYRDKFKKRMLKYRGKMK